MLIFLIGCNTSGGKRDRTTAIEILLSQIYISHYEDDSLNSNRGYVIPRIYYYFEYKNPSADSIYIVLDQYFGDKTDSGPFLYSIFEYNGKEDTLVLADYESVNPILITPKESGALVVGAPIYDFLEKDIYKDETASTLMKYIADNSHVFYFSPSLGGNEILLESQSISKSKDFNVFFRDPNDTAVE
ncbi:hypothetical protein LV85_00632 [Algoriphagus chordae]|uniref:Uncharacterized protein n=2 Tax=Algoriphagus chordae TaxID=237019 RepID=A0A2W7REA2_9BACT|nr:hypothetical protein LV85_00632 [Algoriphagus chordae]